MIFRDADPIKNELLENETNHVKIGPSLRQERRGWNYMIKDWSSFKWNGIETNLRLPTIEAKSRLRQ